MKELTMKEKLAFNFMFNEKRMYHRWYGRWFMFGLDDGRLKRVIRGLAKKADDIRETCIANQSKAPFWGMCGNFGLKVTSLHMAGVWSHADKYVDSVR